MSSNLIHRAPCPQGWQAPPTWPRHCLCPVGWPKYEDDIKRAAERAAGPKMMLTFTLHDGTKRVKFCAYKEAIRQLATAKCWPIPWKNFTIEPMPKETPP